jgi:steroid delta-isomerase-like uncharacterized protein
MSSRPKAPTQTGQLSELIAPAIALINLYNDRKWDSIKNVVSENFQYLEYGTQRDMQGIDEVVSAFRAWASAFPDSRGEIRDTYVSGNTVVIEVVWKGTHTGPLETPRGTIAPTQKRIDLPACQITEVVHGKAEVTRHYFNMMTMMKQIDANM